MVLLSAASDGRKRHLRWLAICVAAFAVLVTIALAILMTMELGRFKGAVEGHLTEFTGRDVSINGELHARLGRTVSIRIEDATLGNAAWSSTPNMLQVDALELRFSLWSVFGRTLKIRYFRLEGVRMLVEAGPEGGVNWSFDPSSGVAEWLSDQSVTEYTIEHADIDDVQLSYGEGWLETPVALDVQRCALRETSDGYLSMSLEGRLDEFAIAASGKAGPQKNLARGRDVTVELDASVGDFRLDADGHFERLNPVRQPEISFEFVGPDIADLLAEAGLPVFTSGAVDLRGKLDQNPPGVILDVAGSVGQVEVDVHGSLDDAERLSGLELGFEASGPSLREFVRVLRIGYVPTGPFKLKGRVQGDEPPFAIDDFSITVGGMSAELSGTFGTEEANVQLAGAGPDFAGFFGTWTERPLPDGPFEINGGVEHRFEDDTWMFRELEARLDSGLGFQLNGSLEFAPAYLGVDARLAASGPELADVLALWIDPAPRVGPFTASAQVLKTRDATRYDDLQATIGKIPREAGTVVAANHVAGTLLYEPGDVNRVTSKLRSDRLDLSLYLDATDAPDAAAPSADTTEDRFFADYRLPLEWLDRADVDVALEVSEIVLGSRRATDAAMQLRVEDGDLTLDPVSASVGGGNVSARIAIDTGGELPAVTAELTARNVVLDDPNDADGNPLNRPFLTLDANIAASGGDLRQLLATSNGSVRVEEGAGLIQFDPLKSLLDAINPPLAEEESINLECYILLVDISEGLAKSSAMAIQTDRLKIAARGKLDFVTEAIDMKFKIVEREGIGVSAASIVSPLVAISGTLMNPGVSFPSEAGVAALITDGYTIVLDVITDIAQSGKNVCEEALKKAERQGSRR